MVLQEIDDVFDTQVILKAKFATDICSMSEKYGLFILTIPVIDENRHISFYAFLENEEIQERHRNEVESILKSYGAVLKNNMWKMQIDEKRSGFGPYANNILDINSIIFDAGSIKDGKFTQPLRLISSDAEKISRALTENAVSENKIVYPSYMGPSKGYSYAFTASKLLAQVYKVTLEVDNPYTLHGIYEDTRKNIVWRRESKIPYKSGLEDYIYALDEKYSVPELLMNTSYTGSRETEFLGKFSNYDIYRAYFGDSFVNYMSDMMMSENVYYLRRWSKYENGKLSTFIYTTDDLLMLFPKIIDMTSKRFPETHIVLKEVEPI
ncbi:MAG: hypothetical protein ACP5UV_01385 [Thermoplasmata archaeon]